MFTTTFVAGWADMDFNSHMANTAFLDRGADARMIYFAAHGFPVDEFRRRQIGPVVRKDVLEYFREIHLLDEIQVTVAIAGMADDGSRFIYRNDIHRPDGELAGRVTSSGGWLDLAERQLIAPPDDLLAVMQNTPRADGFEILPSSVNKT